MGYAADMCALGFTIRILLNDAVLIRSILDRELAFCVIVISLSPQLNMEVSQFFFIIFFLFLC